MQNIINQQNLMNAKYCNKNLCNIKILALKTLLNLTSLHNLCETNLQFQIFCSIYNYFFQAKFGSKRN